MTTKKHKENKDIPSRTDVQYNDELTDLEIDHIKTAFRIFLLVAFVALVFGFVWVHNNNLL